LRESAPEAKHYLSAAIREQLRQCEELTGLALEVQNMGEAVLSRQQSEELQHILKEALCNVRRHTEADKAIVRAVANDEVSLEVSNPSKGRAAALHAAHDQRTRECACWSGAGAAAREHHHREGPVSVWEQSPG
jgi:signal transduction histidine kinase